MDQALIHPETSHQRVVLSKAEPAPWRQALLAGLPHLLFPLAMYNYHFVHYEAYRTLNGYLLFPLTLSFWVVILGGLAFAWRRGWPRWSATWIGYGLVIAVELMLVLPTTGVNVSKMTAITSGILWLALTTSALILIARRDWLDGLLAVLPLMPMWYSYLALDGVIGNEAPIFYADGIIMAIAVTWIVRSGSPSKGLALILAALTLVALPIAYATTYYSNYRPVSGPPPTPEPDGVAIGYLTYLIGFAFLTIPVLLTTLIRWRRRA